MRVALLLVIGVFVAGCSDPEMDAAREKDQRDANYTYEMQRRIKQILKDPDSVEFREVRLSRKGGVPAVCGKVNSRNSFGGMSGFQRFISAGEVQVLEEQMGVGELDKVWNQFC